MLPKRSGRVLAAFALSLFVAGPVLALPFGPFCERAAHEETRFEPGRFEELGRGALRLFGLLGGTLSSLFEAATATPPGQPGGGGVTAESGVTIDPDGTPVQQAH